MAANQRYEITLGIKADVQSAKQQIQSLAADLEKLSKTSSANSPGLAKDIVNASNAALQLKQNIEHALNADTGKLDLSKFNTQLKASGMTLKDYQQTLSALGPAGDAAFSKLATSIQYAEIPLHQTIGLLDKFFDGLKNTFMWTIQSQAIHAFQSALSGAYTYAQQLNKGLTDIAIVSDLRGNELLEFAKTANKYAQELSASTSEYVSGALIYYQAGLSDEEVIERTNTTIKLAQTSGETAEQISSYMTAIWNNFYDGSESIEYYADAISYLGAVTAASNADIAEGIQAFAATADTVGLSFEYSAAALTVLRDVTQQSASTIGNSLKTIFARLEGLKLGETLEDDVDLNKYTKALQAVGVQVLDINGELKAADTILDELASRWNILNDAQKVALAQTIGGVRQYNNLISLMDNYEKFQELVTGAKNSTGYLEEQAEVYADSWEGASDRAKAAWQEFYQEILSGEFFTNLKKIEAGFANLLTMITKGLGGVQGVITSLSFAFFSLFGDRLAAGMRTIAYNLGYQREELEELQKRALDLQIKSFVDAADPNPQYADNIELYKQKILEYNSVKSQLSSSERELYQSILDTNRGIIERIKILDEEANAEKRRLNTLVTLAANKAKLVSPQGEQAFLGYYQDFTNAEDNFLKQQWAETSMRGITTDRFKDEKSGIVDYEQMLEAFRDRIADIRLPGESIPLFDSIDTILNNANLSAEQKINTIQQTIEGSAIDVEQAQADLENAVKNFESIGSALGIDVTGIVTAYEDLAIKTQSIREGTVDLNDSLSNLRFTAQDVKDVFNGVVDSATVAFKLITGIRSGAQVLKRLQQGTIELGDALVGIGSVVLFNIIPAIKKLDMTLMSTKIGLIIAVLYAVIQVLKSVNFWVEKVYYNSSQQKILDDITNSLEKQKETVKELASAYSNLESTLGGVSNAYDKLAETAEKYGKNSAQYQLALIEYNEKLAELEEKYGSDIYKSGSAEIKEVDEDKVARIALEQYNTAIAIQQTLENQQKDAAVATAAENLTTRSGQYMFGGLQVKLGNGLEIETKEFELIQEKIQNALNNHNEWNKVYDTLNNITDTANGAVKNYFIDLINRYKEALENQGTKADFSDLIAPTLKNIGLYDIGNDFNIDENDMNNAFLQYAETLAENASTKQKDKIYSDYAEQQGLVYDNGVFYNTNEQGEKDQNSIKEFTDDELNNIVLDAMKGSVLTDLMTMTPAQIVDILKQNSNFTEFDDEKEMQQYWENMEAKLEEAENNRIRLRGANKDIENAGLSKKEETALNSLIEELKTGTLYADQFSESTLKTEGSIRKLAFAAKQADQGIEDWTKNWYDWKDAINGDDKWAAIEAMDELKDAAANYLAVNDELSQAGITLGKVFGDYVKENLDIVYDAFSGSEEAALKMQRWVAEDIAATMADANNLTDEQLTNLQDNISSTMDTIEAMLDTGDLQLGRVDDTEFLDGLANALTELGIFGDQAKAIFSGLGLEVETEEVPLVEPVWHPATYGYEEIFNAGNAMPHSAFEDAGWFDYVEGKATELKIKTADYVGGGNLSTSKGGAGSRSPKKSGGGGGSKKKTKEKGTNRYHEITEKIGQTKHTLEMLNDEEDRAYGQKKLDLIKEKIKLLEREAKQYQQLYDEAKDYNASDRALLASQYGAKFNKDGTIKDYQKWYDSFVDRYNSGAMDDDAWKAFEDAIKKYEESYKKMNEAEKAYQDLMNQVYDARLAAIEHKLSFLNKEIDEANKHIDFLIEQMSKDIYQLADAMAEMSKQAGNLLNKASNYRQAIIDMFAGKNHEGVSKSMIKGFLNGTVSVGELIEAAGDLTDKEIDMLYEYAAALEEISQQLIELREKQYETLGKVIDGFNEKIERQSDIISDATEILKHYRNVVDIVGKDILGMSDELLKQLSRTAVEGAKANLAVAKLQLDKNKQILEQMRQSLNDQIAAGASEEAIRLMEQAIEDQEDRVREMSENWASAWENALQTAQEAFTDAVKIATDAFSQAVSGSMGNIENLQDMYEKQNTLNDLYLPKYQQIYELNKLTRDVNNAIDNTDNIAGKERLLALQRDINDAMQEGSKVTEYDVGFMQRRLELEMALIALEEAQNAKNQVRMTRDSEGNWSYTYTADAQKVAEAQQNYEDKLYELEKYNQDHVKELQGQMISAFNDYKNEIESLTTLDGEQKAKLLEDYWTQLQNEYGVFLDKALSDGQFIVDTYDAYSHELMTSFSDTILSQVTGFQTLEDMMASFAKASEYMMQLVSDAYSDWDGDWHSIFEIAGVDAENFSGEVSEAMADFGETMDTAVEEAQRFADELGEQFDAALDNLEDFIDKYDKKIQKLIDKNKEAVESILEFIYEYDRLHAKDEEKEKEKEKPTTPTEPTGPSGGDTGTGPGGSPPVSGPPDPRQGQHGITKDGEGYKDLNDQKHIHWIRWTSPLKGTWTDEQQEAHSFGDAYVENSYWYVQCSKCNYKKKLPGGGGLRPVYQMLSSGGYTGAWGPSGKFAMLHEKELVLNKHDTENMLKAVGFVRDLTQMISLNASVANQGLGNLFLGGVSQGGGFLDQTVTIHAEFPNATNHTEIEEAFSNLIGLASQYAGRKK